MAKLLDSRIYGTLISDGLITAKSNIDVGTYLKINTANSLGLPSINIGKPGNNFLGIGSKDTSTTHTIRYGASDGANWLAVNTSYNHEFDGNLKANLIYENGSRVWTAATFNPDTKLDVENGQIKGSLGVEQDLTVGRDLFVTRNLSVNGGSTFTGDITVAGVKFSEKLGKTENAVSATKLKNAVTINGVLFDGTSNITVKAEANGGAATTATKLATARTINGVAFDGSQNITITAAANGGTSASCSGNAATASRLLHALTINGQSFNGSSDVTITIDDSSKLPITGGTLTGSLNIQGELVCTGNVTAFATSLSDRRMKENIISVDNAIDIIDKINVYSFNFRNNPTKRYGVIAQDMQEILPEVVTQTPIRTPDGDLALGVNYQDIFAVLIKAVQEQSKKIKELENKLK